MYDAHKLLVGFDGSEVSPCPQAVYCVDEGCAECAGQTALSLHLPAGTDSACSRRGPVGAQEKEGGGGGKAGTDTGSDPDSGALLAAGGTDAPEPSATCRPGVSAPPLTHRCSLRHRGGTFPSLSHVQQADLFPQRAPPWSPSDYQPGVPLYGSVQSPGNTQLPE